MLLSYRQEKVDSFLRLMKLSVSLCEAAKISSFSSFIRTLPANTFFMQLTCWCPNEEASEWASSQVKNNLWITLPSVHSHSSWLPWSLFYCDICICQLLFVKVVYSETVCSSWRETTRDNSCLQCGNGESREGSSQVRTKRWIGQQWLVPQSFCDGYCVQHRKPSSSVSLLCICV